MNRITADSWLDPLALTYTIRGGSVTGGNWRLGRRKKMANALHDVGVSPGTLVDKLDELREKYSTVGRAEDAFKEWFLETFGPNGANLVSNNLDWGAFQYPEDVSNMAADIRHISSLPPPSGSTALPSGTPGPAVPSAPTPSKLQDLGPVPSAPTPSKLQDLGDATELAPTPPITSWFEQAGSVAAAIGAAALDAPRRAGERLGRVARLAAGVDASEDPELPSFSSLAQTGLDAASAVASAAGTPQGFDYDYRMRYPSSDDDDFDSVAGDDPVVGANAPGGLSEDEQAARNNAAASLRARMNAQGSMGADPGGTNHHQQDLPNGDTSVQQINVPVPTNSRMGGTMSQWGVQSYGVIPANPYNAAQLREAAVRMVEMSDSAHVRPEFAPQQLYFDTPVVGPAPYLGGVYA